MKSIITLALATTVSIASAQSSTAPRLTDVTFATFWQNGMPRHHLMADLTHNVSVSVFSWNTPAPNLWFDYTVASAPTALGTWDFGLTASAQGGRGTTGAWASPSYKNGRFTASGLAYWLVNDRGTTSIFVPNARAGYQVGRANLGLELTGSSDDAGWHQRIGPTLRYQMTSDTFVRISALAGSGGREFRVFYGVKF